VVLRMGEIEDECEAHDLWLWMGLVSATAFGLRAFLFLLYAGWQRKKDKEDCDGRDYCTRTVMSAKMMLFFSFIKVGL